MVISLNLYAGGCILGMIGIHEMTDGWKKKVFDVVSFIFCLAALVMTAVGVVLMYKFGNSCEKNTITHWIVILWVGVNVICSQQIIVLFFKTIKYMIQYRVVPDTLTPVLSNKPPDMTMQQLYAMLTPIELEET